MTNLYSTVYCAGKYSSFCYSQSSHASLVAEKSLDTSKALQIPDLKKGNYQKNYVKIIFNFGISVYEVPFKVYFTLNSSKRVSKKRNCFQY